MREIIRIRNIDDSFMLAYVYSGVKLLSNKFFWCTWAAKQRLFNWWKTGSLHFVFSILLQEDVFWQQQNSWLHSGFNVSLFESHPHFTFSQCQMSSIFFLFISVVDDFTRNLSSLFMFLCIFERKDKMETSFFNKILKTFS